MTDSTHYIEKLTEYLSKADMFTMYTAHLSRIIKVMGNPNRLSEILDSDHEAMIEQSKAFLSALYGIFPRDRVIDLCQIMIDDQAKLDGKEALFYLESALLEVRRYFFRHKKQIAEIMHNCEFLYEQQNEELLPLASMFKCSYEPYMRLSTLFPMNYGDLYLSSLLPMDPAFIEPDRKADILKYISNELREGLLTRGNQNFFKDHKDFFSTFFADKTLFINKFTTIPNDIQNRSDLENELVEYLGILCKEAGIEGESWVDASLLDTWLTMDGYERLLRGMKPFGVTVNVKTDNREDIPDWNSRFRAEKIQFKYWKPYGGFAILGTNSISEYESFALLEQSVAQENKQAASIQLFTYFSLLKKMRATIDDSSFEELIQEGQNLSQLANLAFDIRNKEISEESYLYMYYTKVISSFFGEGLYRILTPSVTEGDTLKTLEDEIFSQANPPYEPEEAPIPCRIEKTTVQSLESSDIKVKATYPGLMRGTSVLTSPAITVETPVSPQAKLQELAESLDNLRQELRTEKDILGVRRYVNSFIYNMRIIEQIINANPSLDTRKKVDWINQNHFIFNLFNYTPHEVFNNWISVFELFEDALDSQILIDEYQEPFYTAWGLCLKHLNSMGVKETLIIPYKTRVTKSELLNGWKKENSENREAGAQNPADLVYGVLKKGIEIDGQIVQKPVVNVYA